MANLTVGVNRFTVGTPIGGATHNEPAVTRAAAKRLMQVSEGSLHRAKVITAKAIPEVVTLAERGGISLAAGAWVAELPNEDQEKFVTEVASGIPADGSAWTGPEHIRCNRADGGRRRWHPTTPAPPRSRVW